MKKTIVAMLAVLLLILPSNVYADTQDSVWKDASANGKTATVTVVTDGTTTSGVLTLAYDADVFSCEDSDVKAAKGVDMYAVNTAKNGTVKISYVAKKAVAEGVMFTITFESASDISATDLESFVLTGDAYTSSGASASVGNGPEKEDSEPGDDDTDNGDDDTDNGDDDTDNGDDDTDNGDDDTDNGDDDTDNGDDDTDNGDDDTDNGDDDTDNGDDDTDNGDDDTDNGDDDTDNGDDDTDNGDDDTDNGDDDTDNGDDDTNNGDDDTNTGDNDTDADSDSDSDVEEETSKPENDKKPGDKKPGDKKPGKGDSEDKKDKIDKKGEAITREDVNKAKGNKKNDVKEEGGKKVVIIANSLMEDLVIKGETSVVPEDAFFVRKYVEEGQIFEDAVKTMEAYLENVGTFEVLEINLYNGDGTSITQLDGTVQVTIPVPENVTIREGYVLVVYRINDDGTLTNCNAVVEDGKITFTTDHFSTYIIVEQEETSVLLDTPVMPEGTEESDDTNVEEDSDVTTDGAVEETKESSMGWIVIVIAIVAAVVAVVLKNKKTK